MSQIIANAFASYLQASLANQTPVVLDEFVLANIPDLDPDQPISPDLGLPPAGQIVHRHAVDQRGLINNDAVAYTIVMDTTVGDFSFNALYLINKASGMVGMIVHKGLETKLKTN
ncbi:phage tail protein [Aeromonas caviae]